MAICLNPDIINRIKQIDLSRTKSTEERLAIFRQFTTEKNAVDISKQYERALLLKNSETAYEKFLKSIGDGTPEQRKAMAEAKDAIRKRLDQRKALIEANPDQFEAILKKTDQQIEEVIRRSVDRKYGVDIPDEAIEKIVVMTKKVKETRSAVGDDLFSLNKEAETIAYIKAHRDLDKYLQSLNPSSKASVFTGVIGKGAMLFSIKNPLFNIIGNTGVGIQEAITRRLASMQLSGTSTALAKKYIAMADRIYNETGFDISRATSIKDGGMSGVRVLGNDTVNAQGKGAVRTVGQWVEKVVFRNMLGKPDNKFANINFIDSVNLNSKKLAKGNQEFAERFMEDAMRLDPVTPEGKMLRVQAIADAHKATLTNISWTSKRAEQIKAFLDKATGSGRAGDILMPFVKTPANFIETSMDYGGLGAIKAFTKLVRGGAKDPMVIKEMLRDISRTVVGFGGALAISSLIDDEDFVGAYDPKRAQIEALKNSNYNAVKIGDKWVSLEWFGALAIPIASIMYHRKGDGYQKGFSSQFWEIPGVDMLKEGFDSAKIAASKSTSDNLMSAAQYTMEQLASRVVPGISNDIAKAFDTKQRDTSGGFFDAVKAKIPGVRNTLPVKVSVLGEERKDESAFVDILFGSRIKTDRQTHVIEELDRVTTSLDKGTTFTDWNKSSSKELAQFKEKVGEAKFNEAKKLYGQTLTKELEKLVNNPAYKRLKDEEKLEQISKQDDQAKEFVFKRYGFKYKQEKKSPLKL